MGHELRSVASRNWVGLATHRKVCEEVLEDSLRQLLFCFFFSSRRRHTRLQGDWSSDVCSSDLTVIGLLKPRGHKFKVTAKGGRRDRVLVQWGMIARFGLLVGLTLAGMLYGSLAEDRKSVV